MGLLVLKFGGTSVGSIERIQKVADRVIHTRKLGHPVIVVLSAMSGDTDRLIQLARAIHNQPDPREYDRIVSTGEVVSTALLSMALKARGCPARSFTGVQAGIKTDSVHTKARIIDINREALLEALEQGIVPVVTGFQGIDELGNVTTLGRGGSDTTAVALAAALEADECQIYTDVDGVYTSDPRVVENAKRIDTVTFEEMLEMASLGAKVLQIRAVEFAGKYDVPLRVLSTFDEGPGTLITYENVLMEQPMVSCVAFDRNQAKLTIHGLPDKPGVAEHIFGSISDANIDVDMIVQNSPRDGTANFSFTVQRDDYSKALAILNNIGEKLKAKEVYGSSEVVKLSLVGVGMRSHPGVAAKMFKVLGKEGINIQLIATSEIKISVIIDEKALELGARSLHSAFGLNGDVKSE